MSSGITYAVREAAQAVDRAADLLRAGCEYGEVDTPGSEVGSRESTDFSTHAQIWDPEYTRRKSRVVDSLANWLKSHSGRCLP